ncbi:MAG: hypothetical protein NTV39_00145 [Candidatus Saccharibacteria bacterium]|nr:hypothetical protein [Candidatus Saccharibacteria bacterium]
MDSRRKIILLGSAGFFVVLIVIALLYTYYAGKASVSIIVAPTDSELILDNNSHVNAGDSMLTLGTHTIKVSRSGFASKTLQFVVSKNDSNIVPIALVPNSSEGNTYLINHSSDFVKVGDLEIPQTDAINRAIKQQSPIIKALPIDVSPLYVITYGTSVKYPTDPSKFAIYINAATPAGRQYALRDLNDRGFDVSDYEIVFDTVNNNNGGSNGN